MSGSLQVPEFLPFQWPPSVRRPLRSLCRQTGPAGISLSSSSIRTRGRTGYLNRPGINVRAGWIRRPAPHLPGCSRKRYPPLCRPHFYRFQKKLDHCLILIHGFPPSAALLVLHGDNQFSYECRQLIAAAVCGNRSVSLRRTGGRVFFLKGGNEISRAGSRTAGSLTAGL